MLNSQFQVLRSKHRASVQNLVEAGNMKNLTIAFLALAFCLCILGLIQLSEKKSPGQSSKWPSSDIRSRCKIYIENDWETNPSIPSWKELGIKLPAGEQTADEFIVPSLSITEQDGLKRVEKEGKIGVQRGDGSFVLEPKYDYVDFPQKKPSRWIAWAISDHTGSRFGFTNKDGVEMERKYLKVKPFSNGLAPVRSEAGWGYINEKGELKVPFRFQIANDFNDGYAAVNLNNKWGYINESGQLVVPPLFDSASTFQHGMARVRSRSFWGVLQKSEFGS